ncbi:MAG: hypothetical protein R3A46_14165 [Thermomicrobiales bacterium]
MAEERAPTDAQAQVQAEAESRLDQHPDPANGKLTPAECIDQLRQLRPVVMPMLEACKERYTGRVRPGYPTMVDNIERGGVFGINLDPSFGAYFMTDGETVFAEVHRVALRTDTLSAANYEKFGGRPTQDRIDLDLSGDLIRQSRNVISRLLNAWTQQQTFLFRVDS